MPLDPRLKPLVEGSAAAPPPEPGASVADMRVLANDGLQQMYGALTLPPPPIAGIRDERLRVDGGEVSVRLYTPLGDGPFPGHLYIHGGGFWMGEPRHFDSACAWTAAEVGCVVASVDYRLAPEYKFPTAAEDAYRALEWMVAEGDRLHIDTTKLSVGGASAGGNLAAAVALMARDRGGPTLAAQIVECAALDLTMGHPSVAENGEGYLLTKTAMEQYFAFYLADPSDATNPYASPVLAEDLSQLPPALVITTEFDPLRDEGEAYARRLAAAGVPTTLKRWDGQIHGSHMLDALIVEEGEQSRRLVHSTLRAAYAGTLSDDVAVGGAT